MQACSAQVNTFAEVCLVVLQHSPILLAMRKHRDMPALHSLRRACATTAHHAVHACWPSASMRASSSVSMSDSYARWIFWNLSLASSAFSGCLSGCHTLASFLQPPMPHSAPQSSAAAPCPAAFLSVKAVVLPEPCIRACRRP